MKLDRAYTTFVESSLYAKGSTARTIETYNWSVGTFIKSANNIEIEAVTIDDIMRWRHDMDLQNFDRNSIVACLYKTRMFLRWCKRTYKIDFEPDEIIIPKTSKKLPKYLTLDEAKKVYHACADERERMIVLILFSTGIRISELANIRLDHIRDNKILIQGKGDKQRYVYMNDDCTQAIKDYLKNCPYTSKYLVNGYKGPMTRSGISKVITDISSRCKIGKKVTAHMLRHTFATQLLTNGCNLRYIQELLGHADISTTQMYTHVSNNDLQTAYTEFSSSLS